MDARIATKDNALENWHRKRTVFSQICNRTVTSNFFSVTIWKFGTPIANLKDKMIVN